MYLVITLQQASNHFIEDSSSYPFQELLNIFSVVTVFRRYHTRYHSNVASLLYLVDLHVILILFHPYQ